MRKRFIQFLSLLIVCVTVFSCCILPAGAATKASFGTNSYCEVRINQSLISRAGRQYATVKLNTYDQLGWKSWAKVVVTMKDEYGRVIWSGQKKGGDTLQLGDDHRIYRIYIRVYDEPLTGGIFKRSIIQGNNFTNRGGCVTWQFTNAKNCSIR